MSISLQVPPTGAIDAVLKRIHADGQRCFGTPDVAAHVRRVIVRPFSQVLELHVTNVPQPTTAFVKILKPRFETPEELEATRRHVRREFDTVTRVHRALGSTTGLTTLRPVACYPELLAVVTERLEGEPLTRVLATLRGVPPARTVEGAAEVMRNVAVWLTAFQATEAAGAPVSLERMRAYLDARLRPLAELGICSSDMRADLLRYFDRRAREVPASDLASVPVHADFTPENVLAGAEGVGVLDFTMAARGVRYLDLAHMYVQVEMLKARPWFRRTVIDHQTTALLRGFDRSLQADRALFELLRLQNVACLLLQNARSRASGLRARLLAGHVRRWQVTWLTARARSR